MQRKGLIAALAAALVAIPAAAADITGAGATFPYPIYAKWADAYRKATGVGLNYQSIGSGGGIKQITARTVDFGASDAPMKAEDLEKNGLIQFPAIMGGVVPVYNVKGIEAGKLRLNGQVLAEIYLGKITSWDDPAIAKLNPGASLPSTKITPVYRSDGSGDTYAFTNYLSTVDPEFKSKVGTSTQVKFPTGVGAEKNDGVSAAISQTDGAIGYVGLAYALQNELSMPLVENSAGEFPTGSMYWPRSFSGTCGSAS